MQPFKILLIEDNPVFKGLWEAIIGRATHENYKIDWANTDFIASELLANNTYDIIISDIILAGRKTGIDLWQENDCKDSFFIFTSSIPQNVYQEFMKGIDKKPDAFIQKPLNLKYCIELLSTIIRHEMRIRATTG